jgi:hypothetical protein
MHLDLTGRIVPRGRQRAGRAFIVENHDPVASWQYLRSGGLTVRDWGRSLRAVREPAWLAADDPIPFLAMCARFLLARLTRLTGRRSRAAARNGQATRPRYVRGRRRSPNAQGSLERRPSMKNPGG